MRVLVLNPGSSSLKASLIEIPGDRTLATTGASWRAEAGEAESRARVLRATIDELRRETGGAAGVDAVGYRVVHGGAEFRAATLIDDTVVARIQQLDELAPLHNRIAAETIHAARGLLEAIPHVACFDTAFHATLDEAAWRYPVPADWFARRGIRRFGFHGLSVAWAVERSAALMDRPLAELNLVVAHLGAGSSVTAVAAGRSVDTSMGFTPLEGLMMGTRSGSIDPGIVFHLLRSGLETQELADALEHRSGLLGVSGRSADVAELEDATSSGDEAAALSLELYARRAAAGIAAVATALDRLDAIAFTGGIGENAQAVLARICARLAVLGVPRADVEAAGDAVLVRDPMAVVVIHAREDVVIARQTAHLLGRA